eukprot:2010556-Rhodomonas_salina.2
MPGTHLAYVLPVFQMCGTNLAVRGTRRCHGRRRSISSPYRSIRCRTRSTLRTVRYCPMNALSLNDSSRTVAAPYAMSDTAIGFVAIALRVREAISGCAAMVLGGTKRSTCTRLWRIGRKYCKGPRYAIRLRACFAISGTDELFGSMSSTGVAYGAMQCPVLT